MYCRLLNRLQLTDIEQLRVPQHSQQRSTKTYTSCPKHESMSLHDLPSTDCNLLDISFITSLK